MHFINFFQSFWRFFFMQTSLSHAWLFFPLSSLSFFLSVIEKFTENTRFCLICNYLSKIIPALQSRCTRFRFGPLSQSQMIPRLEHVIQQERWDSSQQIQVKWMLFLYEISVELIAFWKKSIPLHFYLFIYFPRKLKNLFIFLCS